VLVRLDEVFEILLLDRTCVAAGFGRPVGHFTDFGFQTHTFPFRVGRKKRRQRDGEAPHCRLDFCFTPHCRGSADAAEPKFSKERYATAAIIRNPTELNKQKITSKKVQLHICK
jgi:hypothetical protein